MIALGWGVRHAFDADHIMTIAGLSQSFNPPRRQASGRLLAFCLHWSIGHGGTLVLIGALVLLLGMTIPYQLSHYAEFVCALILLSLGSGILISSGLTFHAKPHYGKSRRFDKLALAGNRWLRHHPKQSALSIGFLHGLSGSAPLLALLPILNLQSSWHGLLYLLCFGVGVSLGMMLFASGLSYGYRRFANCQQSINRLRMFTGVLSLLYGAILLMENS